MGEGCAKASYLPSLGCPGCFSSQPPCPPHLLPGRSSSGPRSCDPRCRGWGGGGGTDLAKAWGCEVKGLILQVPEREWRQLKVPHFPIAALTGCWGFGTAEVEEELV